MFALSDIIKIRKEMKNRINYYRLSVKCRQYEIEKESDDQKIQTLKAQKLGHEYDIDRLRKIVTKLTAFIKTLRDKK